MDFDKLIAKLVALGIPALVLLIVIATTGLAGGAAIVAALAILGGPLGMLGGIAVLGLLVLVCNGLAEYGFEAIFVAVLKGLKEKGHTKAAILKAIDSYPISIGLKLKLKMYVEQFWGDDDFPLAGSTAETKPPAPKGGDSEAKDFPTESSEA